MGVQMVGILFQYPTKYFDGTIDRHWLSLIKQANCQVDLSGNPVWIMLDDGGEFGFRLLILESFHVADATIVDLQYGHHVRFFQPKMPPRPDHILRT